MQARDGSWKTISCSITNLRLTVRVIIIKIAKNSKNKKHAFWETINHNHPQIQKKKDGRISSSVKQQNKENKKTKKQREMKIGRENLHLGCLDFLEEGWEEPSPELIFSDMYS